MDNGGVGVSGGRDKPTARYRGYPTATPLREPRMTAWCKPGPRGQVASRVAAAIGCTATGGGESSSPGDRWCSVLRALHFLSLRSGQGQHETGCAPRSSMRFSQSLRGAQAWFQYVRRVCEESRSAKEAECAFR